MATGNFFKHTSDELARIWKNNAVLDPRIGIHNIYSRMASRLLHGRERELIRMFPNI